MHIGLDEFVVSPLSFMELETDPCWDAPEEYPPCSPVEGEATDMAVRRSERFSEPVVEGDAIVFLVIVVKKETRGLKFSV